jgi:pectinesterase
MLLNGDSRRAAATAAALLALAACFCAATGDGDMAGPRPLVLVVDQSGKGDHRRIQDAIDAAPAPASNLSAGGRGSVVIRIKPGVYRQVCSVDDDGLSRKDQANLSF